ncbi:hypothetical protein PAXINDRAFT_21148 [Paxillus involutus ATCC 200175]|uniref:Uncharacterized protein n=1 Tax=Paxillus involutus ATCC 200175 TaxID=664439 RepID=A0A0C9T259_PAXIN|nr:hypothetical protein PAXINDRAFT_21148 [Paxillus involutus ATCC 200175]
MAPARKKRARSIEYFDSEIGRAPRKCRQTGKHNKECVQEGQQRSKSSITTANYNHGYNILLRTTSKKAGLRDLVRVLNIRAYTHLFDD